jgi:2'-5' RNA ligase
MRSALIIEVPEAESLVHRWRLHHDPVAACGVPAHVTVLYPFVDPAACDESTLDDVRRAMAGAEPFDYELVRVDGFPGVIWLRPDPDDPFRELTKRAADAFPEHPPYEGRIDEPQPHLTAAMVSDAIDQAELTSRIREDVDWRLPVSCRAATVSLFVENEHDSWSRFGTVELGS